MCNRCKELVNGVTTVFATRQEASRFLKSWQGYAELFAWIGRLRMEMEWENNTDYRLTKRASWLAAPISGFFSCHLL